MRLINFRLLVISFAAILLGLLVFADGIAQEWDLGPVPGVEIECLAISDTAGALPPNPFLDGSWLQFRRDRKLSGRSPLIGNITCPKLLWNIDLGARKHWFSISPANTNDQLMLSPSGSIGDSYGLRIAYQVHEKLIDLEGDGSQQWSADGRGSWKIGNFLEPDSSHERVICSSGDYVSVLNKCSLQQWRNNGWREVWQRDLDFIRRDNTPNRPIVGDFDMDGVDEIAVLSWYEMQLLELESGDHEQTGEFLDPEAPGVTTGRGYGWYGAYNLDADPRSEFVILGDFEHFIAVLGWEGENFKLLWDRRIERGNYETFVRHHTGVNPVADIDGDGFKDIVTSIFNETGDLLWHVIGLSATGEEILNLTGTYLSGVGDLDGDLVSELLVTETNTHGTPEYGRTSVRSYKDGEWTELWSSSTEGFELHAAPVLPDNVNTSATHYRRTALVSNGWNGLPVFMTREPVGQGPDIKLRLYQWHGEGIVEVGSATGPRLKLLQMPDEGPESDILLQSISENANDGPVTLVNATATLKLTGRVENGDGAGVANTSLLTSTVAGALKSGGIPAVVTQDYDLNIRAFAFDSGLPNMLWRHSGRGMTSGDYGRTVSSVNAFNSVALADIKGTGNLATIVADRSDEGSAMIRAINPNGGIYWERKLPAAGAPPKWNDSGITHWTAGHFTSPEHEDVLVSLRRVTHRNSELHLLNGLTGEILWSIIQGGQENCDDLWVGPGSTYLTILDFDGDGLDDILHSDELYFAIHRGTDGEMLLNRTTLAKGDGCPELKPMFEQTVWIQRVIPAAEFLGNGELQLLHGKNEVTMALMEVNGDVIWHTPFNEGLPFNVLQGIGNLDGNGQLEIIAAGPCNNSESELRVYEAENGLLRWTLPMPDSDDCSWPGPKALATGDLDGDGKEEVLIMSGNVLHAAGEINGQGQWLWRATFGPNWNETGFPVIADVDGSGRPQILVNTPDGYLFGLGSNSEVIQINAGHSGAWFNPATSGQGQFIDVEPETQFMFISWFTYTDAASDHPNEQQWYTAQGNYSGNTAHLDLFETLGGKFDAPQEVSTTQVGEVTLVFNDCGVGHLAYHFDDEREGNFPMQRVIPGSGNTCEERSNINIEAVDLNAGMDGAWFEQTTSGQGFLIDSYPDPEGGDFIFVSWFTYGDETTSGQRWLTAQGNYEGPSTEIDVFETTGGSFDDPLAPDTVKAGTMTIDFTDCSNAELSYSLTEDVLEGDIAITRVVPAGQALCEELSGAD